MSSAIPAPIKRAVLRLLESRGYSLVRLGDAGAGVARRGNAAPAAPPSPASPPPARPISPSASRTSRPAQQQLPDFWPMPDGDLGADTDRFLDRAHIVLGSAVPAHATALFAAMRALVTAAVSGDIVDCGEGDPTNIALIAVALMTLGDVDRRLVMFDVTGDASHRPDTELQLWGGDRADLIDERVVRQRCWVEAPPPLPHELAATGYPAERINIAHYPAETPGERPIAFLGLMTDTYQSNRAAIRALVPRVVAGGVIGVTGGNGPRASQPGCVQHPVDAVDQYLKGSGRELQFWQAASHYRLALQGGGPGQARHTNAT